MHETALLLKKAAKGCKKTPLSLATFQPLSLIEIRKRFENVLSWSEAKHLYREAQEQLKKNKILESRIFTHANPQLPQAIRSGIRNDATSRSYESMFGSRSYSFVEPGSVASMFSPAGYLTELYREARGLHSANSIYNIDVRRPDLAELLLSQENMDEEISTLTLSNDIILSHVEKQKGISGDALLEQLSTDRFSAATPYHQPYETLRQSILALDPELNALTSAPDVLGEVDNLSLLSIITNIPPELHDILVEEISNDDEEIVALYKKNFPHDLEYFNSAESIKKYYNLTEEEVRDFQVKDFNIPENNNDEQNGPIYVDGRLTKAIFGENGSIIIYHISKTSAHDQYHYVELIPLGGLKFNVAFSPKYTSVSTPRFVIRTKLDSETVLYRDDNFIPIKDNHYNIEITLTQEQIENGVQIGLQRASPSSGYYWSCASYAINVLNTHSYMLKLNKLIRVCRATGLTPEQLESIIYSAGTNGKINESIIILIFNSLYFRQKYNTDLDRALVLATANISQFTGHAEVSHFDRLFNTPPLAGEWFYADGTVINAAPDATDDVFARDSILRGLNITRGELYQLVLMAGLNNEEGKLPLTLEHISILYRLSLVAHLNNLTVNELYLLFTVSPINDGASVTFVQYIYQLSRWLTDAGLSATEVWLLTSKDYPQTLTPEMLTLRGTLTATDIEAADNDTTRRRLIAPNIAGALGLSSPTMATSLMLWCENAGYFTLGDFLKLLMAETLKPVDEAHLAEYLHILAQYSMTVQALSLSEAEVGMLAGIPGTRQLLSGVAWDNALARLMSLHYFHQWLNTLGRESSAVLAALNDGKLNITLIASAMGLDEVILIQALQCVDENAGAETALSSWQSVYKILQWVNVATALNTMPVVVKQLLDIRLSGEANEPPSWEEWKNISRSLEAALTQRQATALTASSAGRLSEVLCGCFLASEKMGGLSLRSRDELYSYFLIDNQVSSEVKTTRLAEAIAGIQLYINRTLNGIEPNAVPDVFTRQFFIDWEMNSRYSSWGGVSRLAYYPENYVDPLQRIGQTEMMDKLLQSINQSQLSEDIVEDAFRAYLARFETIADLKVISAYHDNVNSDFGKTWFIGRSREVTGEYYWRNVELSAMTKGVLPANAWTEWKKIEAPITAWGDTSRPVIFRNRLHVVWLEREEIAENGTSTPKILLRYTLKITFLKHDGTWSSPWSYDITDVASKVSATEALTGLAVSHVVTTGKLCVLVYVKAIKYSPNDFSDTSKVNGLLINGDMIRENFVNLTEYNSLHSVFDLKDADNIPGVKKANYVFAIDYSLSLENMTLKTAVGEQRFTIIDKCALSGLTLNKNEDQNYFINIQQSDFSIRYEVSNNQLMQNQLQMIQKQYAGDRYLLHSSITPRNGNNYAYFVYNSDKNKIVGSTSERPSNYNISAINLKKDDDALFEVDWSATYTNDRSADFKKCNVSTVSFWKEGQPNTENPTYKWEDLYSTLSGVYELDTSINNNTTGVTVRAGSYSKFYKASDSALSLPVVSTMSDMQYVFNPINIAFEDIYFYKNTATVDIEYVAKNNAGKVLGKTSGAVEINKVDYSPASILQMHETQDGVQYMQHGAYRTRLNTLLASQLVSRSNTGIDSILSMETQKLPEPKLGKGFYVEISLPAYDESIHGSSRAFSLYLKHVFNDAEYIIHTGQLADNVTAVQLFVPLDDIPLHEDYIAKIYLKTQKISEGGGDRVNVHFAYNEADPNKPVYDERSVIINKGLSALSGFDRVEIIRGVITMPLDFNSSSALYYWELFYYVPMMCFRRFLDENKLSEANTWINFIWNPNGYVIDGEIAQWTWNCRPLEETTSWNANPLDAIDPDAVAQNDPTHYKVATFMRFVELLITRGDMCYRELTRDALNEAKMRYVQALSLMGDEPQDFGSATWGTLSLASAAITTTRDTYQSLLATIEPDITFPDSEDENGTGTDVIPVADTVTVNELTAGEYDGQTRSANSLTGLFLPEYNPALTEIWATLRLRLYNLRHNLSIDGQPLNLPIYAAPADPAALLSSMVQASAGGAALPKGALSLYRFPIILERARNLAGQLTQFGSTLLNIAQHQDVDELNSLMLHQGLELAAQSLLIQKNMVNELVADRGSLEANRRGAQDRLDKYSALYDEDTSSAEQEAMSMSNTAAGLAIAAQPLLTLGGTLNALPNIYGLACGGAKYGAPATAIGAVLQISASSLELQSNKISRSEMYRRRREEWEIQRINAQHEIEQIDAQLEALAVRLESARLQVNQQEAQQKHTLAQLEFMQRKFTNQALYNWMRGRLSAIYYQFYDIAQSCCLMAQETLRRELNDNKVTFIRSSAWNASTAGFMAGETLLLNLTEMDKAWMERDERGLEVTRTVSLAQVYATLPDNHFIFKEKLSDLLESVPSTGGDGVNDMVISGETLIASVKLSDLKIKDDYPAEVLNGGNTRRIKQINVTLPALVGPYEDVRAVMSYGGSLVLPRGCNAIAVSHGISDSGQFQLDFNDARYLPFEGIPVDDTGALTLSFPDATSRQRALLESLNDIILHIRYIINS